MGMSVGKPSRFARPQTLSSKRLRQPASSAELLRITSHKAEMTPGNGVGGIDFKGAPEFGLGL